MEVIKQTLWKRCLSTPAKPPAKNSNICLLETAYQHKGTRKKCKNTSQAAIIQWQRQCTCLMYNSHRKPRPKSKTSDISKQSPSPLHHTFLLGRARFTAQPLSALTKSIPANPCKHRGKTSTHAPGWAFPVSFSVTLSSQIKVSRAPSASFCVVLLLLVFLTIL